MKKILLGISFLLSAVLLTGCGGGSGTSGSAGADGAAGTIAAPGAGSVALTASTTADTDTDLGQVARTFTVSGTDNTTADSRLRYYAYLGTSSTSKDFIAEASGTNGVALTENTWSGSVATWPLDTRLKPQDNFTATMSADQALGNGDGDTTHLIVCPGNEAGDATSCASVEIDDIGVNYGNVGGTSGDTAADNSTLGGVVPTGSANAFQMFHTNSTGGGVIAETLTESHAGHTTGSASTAHNTSASYTIGGAVAGLGTSNGVFVLVQDNLTNDNGTMWYRTGTSGDLTLSTVTTSDTYPIRKGAMLVPVSDTYAYAVWARGTANADNDNATLVYATYINLSTPSATQLGGGAFPLTAKIADDNNSQLANNSMTFGALDGLPSDYPFCAAGRAESSTVSELVVGYADNGTEGQTVVAANWMLSFTRDSDNFSDRTATDTGINTDKGATATQVCGLAWAGGLLDNSTATDNGTLWFAGNQSTQTSAADNVSLLYSTFADNGSTATMTQAGSIDYGDEINQIAVTYDYLNRPYVAALLDNGSVFVSWVHSTGTNLDAGLGLVPYGNSDDGGATHVADSSKPISFVRSADGTQLALSYHTSSTQGTDMKVAVIYTDR